MSHPYASFIVWIDDDDVVQARSTWEREAPNNSHDTICKRKDAPNDRVLKVEIKADDVMNATFPSPWAIDRLPVGVASFDLVDPRIIAATDIVVAELLTPNTMYDYLSIMTSDHKHHGSLARGLFNDDYYYRLIEWAALHAGNDDDDISRITANIFTSQTTTTPCPQFYLEDLQNPVVWTTLPPSRDA